MRPLLWHVGRIDRDPLLASNVSPIDVHVREHRDVEPLEWDAGDPHFVSHDEREFFRNPLILCDERLRDRVPSTFAQVDGGHDNAPLTEHSGGFYPSLVIPPQNVQIDLVRCLRDTVVYGSLGPSQIVRRERRNTRSSEEVLYVFGCAVSPGNCHVHPA